MGLFENFPYTNFQNLNLDYLLRETKNNVENINNINEQLKTLDDTIDQHIENLISSGKIDTIIGNTVGQSWLANKKIVVYGDSTAEISVSYIYAIANKMTSANITNRAIGGSTLSTTTTDPQNGYTLINAATDLDNFDMLFLCYGTNDWATGTPLYGNNSGTWFGALRDTIRAALAKNPSLYIVVFLPLYSTTDGTVPEKNGLGMTVRDYAELGESLCAYLGIPVYNLNKISGSGIYNYTTMMQHELETTYVHELAPLGERIAEYVINTPPQAYKQELIWSKCPQIAFPLDVSTLASRAVPNRYISPNNFAVNKTATIPFTTVENQIYTVRGYTTGPVTLSIDGITSYRIRWAGEFSYTFVTTSASTSALTFTSDSSIVIAGLMVGTNSFQQLYGNNFHFMSQPKSLQKVNPRTEPEFEPGMRLTKNGLEVKLSGYTATAEITANSVIGTLPFTIPGTLIVPAYNMSTSTLFCMGFYKGGGVWTLSDIGNGNQFFILPGTFPFS